MIGTQAIAENVKTGRTKLDELAEKIRNEAHRPSISSKPVPLPPTRIPEHKRFLDKMDEREAKLAEDHRRRKQEAGHEIGHETRQAAQNVPHEGPSATATVPPADTPNSVIVPAHLCPKSASQPDSSTTRNDAVTTTTAGTDKAAQLRGELTHTDAKYVLHEEPLTCLRQIVLYALNGPGEPYSNAVAMLARCKFDVLYPGTGINWNQRFGGIYDHLSKTQTKKRTEKHQRLLSFVIDWEVENRILAADLSIRTKAGKRKFDLTYPELSYLLKTITHKVLKANLEKGHAWATLARGYFVTEKYREAYRKATGLRLNKDKVAAITNVLQAHGFIEKRNRITPGAAKGQYEKFHVTKYKLGPQPLLQPT